MFERNKIDNAVQQTTVPAELTLDDGQVVKGRFVITANRNIYEVLNGETHFLDFETYEGERSLIARSTIKAVRIIAVASANHLKGRVRENEPFDPYAILGVTQGTCWEEIRAAYVNLSKVYHPDRFASIALPVEVRDYLSAMARRVNSAYAALEAPVQAARRANLTKAQPVFTSGTRI